MKSLITLCVCFPLFLNSCKSTAKEKTVTKEFESNQKLLTVKTSVCYGRCPVYKMTYFSDYTVEIVPKKFCSFDTTYKNVLSGEKIETFKNLLHNVDSDTLNSSYKDTLLMDVPTIKLVFFKNTDSVATKINSTNPETLSALYQFTSKYFKQIENIHK